MLSVPGKVFSRVTLNRIANVVEHSFGDSQFGFRPGRETVYAIHIVRQLIEKAKEREVALHFHFVDFQAAFDTVWRAALWKTMLATGIHPVIVKIMQEMYDKTKCAVKVGGQLTEWFEVGVGVCQGCTLSPTLFNIFLEYVMKEVGALDPDFNFTANLMTEVRYADDTTLIATDLTD